MSYYDWLKILHYLIEQICICANIFKYANYNDWLKILVTLLNRANKYAYMQIYANICKYMQIYKLQRLIKNTSYIT